MRDKTAENDDRVEEENLSPCKNLTDENFDPPSGTPDPPQLPPTREIACQTDKFSIITSLDDKSKLYTFTGVSKERVIDLMTECALSVAPDCNKIALPMKIRICLCLTKLKLNLSFAALSVLYGVSRKTCANYFKDTIQLLSGILKGLNYLPSKEETLDNMPKCFQKFWRTPLSYIVQKRVWKSLEVLRSE